MSTPVKICRFAKAMHDKEEFDLLVRDMAFNLKQQAYNITECDHSPKCKRLSPEDELTIKKRLLAAVNDQHINPNARWLF